MINGMPWVNTLRYTPKVTKHQNSRQLGGGWVGATLSAISRQKVTLIIVNDPLLNVYHRFPVDCTIEDDLFHIRDRPELSMLLFVC